MVLGTVIQNPHHALDTHTEPMVQYIQYCYGDPTEQGGERVQAACYLSTQQPGEQHGIRTAAYQAVQSDSRKLRDKVTDVNAQTNCRPYWELHIGIVRA
jgi:hypothetical protein